MSIELHVIHASDFIHLGADEYLDVQASKDALRTLAQACCERGINCAVLDLRQLPVEAKPHFTTSELAALVVVFRDAGFTRQQRLAVLYSHDIHGGIRSFAFISRMRGLQVQAFLDFESAFLWLAEIPGHRGRGKATPISINKHQVTKTPPSPGPDAAATRPISSRPARRTPRKPKRRR